MKNRLRIAAIGVLSACTLSLQSRTAAAATPGAGADIKSPPAAFAGGPPSGPRPHPLAPGPSMRAALEIAHAAVAACHGHHIGITVLDAWGYPKLIYIPDGSQGFHAFMSFRKANTALQFKMPSGEVAAAMKADPKLAAKYEAGAHDFITFAGGLLLHRGTELIGAVGVSGAGPSRIDEGCARAGIKAAQSLLDAG